MIRTYSLKPLHVKWLVGFYNQITSEAGSKIIENGWRASGIYDAIEMGGSTLPLLDSFQDISSLPIADDGDDARGIYIVVNVPSEVKDGFINIIEDVDDDDGEEFYDWEHDQEEDFDRSAFDIIIDKLFLSIFLSIRFVYIRRTLKKLPWLPFYGIVWILVRQGRFMD